jgi:hypothetical protein
MKRKFVSAVVAFVAMVAGLLAVATPAQAVEQPADINGYKFWTPSVCVEPGSGIPDDISQQTYYRLAYIAQQWNLRSNGVLKLDYSTDCAADGYTPSRRMVIGTYSGATDGGCLAATNQQTEGLNGFARWTNSPGMYINRNYQNCVYNQTYRDHMVSESIGYLLGLKVLNSTGYNSRVMNNTAWSLSNVPLPDVYSGQRVAEIYSGMYCQPAGTVC